MNHSCAGSRDRNAAYFLKIRCRRLHLREELAALVDWPKKGNVGSHREIMAAQLSRTWRYAARSTFDSFFSSLKSFIVFSRPILI
jgi:hypothetical protein